MLVPSQILPMALRWRARTMLKPNQVAPEGGEEEGGPVDECHTTQRGQTVDGGQRRGA